MTKKIIIEKAIAQQIKKKEQLKLAKEAIAIMKKGFAMGNIVVNSRSELYQKI